ncbi:tipN [Brevundimonas sp. LM2]|uniref:tipN n=1 Tax=Brevundimonas sp. LM2 TaxID=1938605 RepID=UPI000983AB58|nr:tipN [Brevundimonas sp. LM2]AQR61603.1 tipN [Brevundimonas sp. LM2]
MKSRQRPPLVLTDPEATFPAEATAPDDIGIPDETPAATPAPSRERPVSERRRRRLLEQERQHDAVATVEPEVPPAAAAPAPRPEPRPEPPTVAPFAVSADAPPARYSGPELPAPSTLSTTRAPQTGAPYAIAGVASALWIGGVAAWAAYEIGAGDVLADPLRLAIYTLIALAPAGLALMLAHAIRQGNGLALETRRARQLAEALVAPTALAAQQAGDVLSALRNDIDQAALAAERARNDMALLREALSLETNRLNEAAENAGRTARRLTEQLGREREEMATLGGRLDGQASGVLDAVERQSRLIVDASDLAQTQLREAETALAARAADLAAAANEAQDAARLAADDLARQTLRLENAGTGVAEQILSVEQGLGQQRAALVTAAYALRTDQEDFSAQVESQRAQLTEQLSAARAAAGDLGQTSTRASEGLRDLVESATDQFRALVDLSQREADGFDAATKLSLDRFEALAAEARDTLLEETRRALAMLKATAEESRAAADEAAGQAQIRADRLGEALFDAAQKADQAADARVDGARRIVQETSGLVDQAGQRAIEKLESTLSRMTQALGEVDAAIGDLDERASRLPEEARARAEAVRVTVEEGLAALAAASRKAAADTEALDAGFQDRVRRNYDMLTEAVRLMGVVSGDPQPMRRREPSLETLATNAEDRPRRVEAEPEPERDRGFGLRGRLRLSPAGGEPPARPTAPAQDKLDWNDLVDDRPGEAPMTLDTPVMPADDDALADRITAAIRRMGVDPNALLPRSRVEEAATAFAERDPDRARQIVRRVAPAAVRSVSRRVMSDADLRADAERYVRGFAIRLGELGRKGDGPAVLATLATDGGRAFMLLDAAVGDLA